MLAVERLRVCRARGGSCLGLIELLLDRPRAEQRRSSRLWMVFLEEVADVAEMPSEGASEVRVVRVVFRCTDCRRLVGIAARKRHQQELGDRPDLEEQRPH